MDIVGVRLNFIKIAPLMKEMKARQRITPALLHTGQHYDVKMAMQFFQDLGVPGPDFSLAVGAGSHAVQTAEVMKRLEPVFERERSDCLLFVGDHYCGQTWNSR
jgi:UDP-N-acetylglucosamine 2-epimerase (non-hydrolysing)